MNRVISLIMSFLRTAAGTAKKVTITWTRTKSSPLCLVNGSLLRKNSYLKIQHKNNCVAPDHFG